MIENNWKKFWKKFWFIVWKDESPKGWIISIIFIFVIIKFIFFPLMTLATGTALPLAIVESCSMHHKGNLFSDYDSWEDRHETKYDQFNINLDQFKKFSFHNGFTKGDILFIVGAKPEKLKVGNVIIFDGGSKNPIIHRIVEINGNEFSTMGDNNPGQISVEKSISQDQIIGKAVFRITPSVGWVKLIFYEFLRPESERGFCNER